MNRAQTSSTSLATDSLGALGHEARAGSFSRSGESLVVALALATVAAAIAFGFWQGAGHRLLKLEAALGLATAGLAVVPLALMVRASADPPRPIGQERVDTSPLLRLAVSLLSAAAALVHFAVIKQHIDEYLLYGAFFVVVGAAQLTWALLVSWRPSGALYWVGAVGNAAIVVFFVVTRTVGSVIGPEASSAAALGFGDTVTTVYEGLIVVLCLSLALRRNPRLFARATTVAGGGSLLTLLLAPQTALALQSAISSAPFVPHAG